MFKVRESKEKDSVVSLDIMLIYFLTTIFEKL